MPTRQRVYRMKKNDIYEITIDDIGNDGEGIGHILEDNVTGSFCDGENDGRGVAVFVKDTALGDVAKIRITKVKKNYAYGRLEELIKPSPVRVEPICPNAKRCGGCSLMHIGYDKQLEYKFNKVKNCLERLGGVENAERYMEKICGMDIPYHYRNKMQFPVGIDRDGRVQIGFYAGRTHSIIDLDRCYIGHPVNDYLVGELHGWLERWQKKTGRFIYDEEKHTGLVRHILTRVGFVTGELMVCIIVNGDSLAVQKTSNKNKSGGNISVDEEAVNKELIECLNRAVDAYNRAIGNEPNGKNDLQTVSAVSEEKGSKNRCETSVLRINLTSVSININKEKTNRILGNRCVTLYGNDYITDYIGDIRFNISPMSFYQVNPVQTKVLYDKAVEFAGLTGDEVVWDMYCGIGTISLCLAKKAKKVYGVEIVPQAIEDAKENASINNLTNTEFFCGKAEEVVPAFYNGTLEAAASGETGQADIVDGCHPDVVVVDPPRKGCDSTLLDTIHQMAPKRLVYVSCDPATLARDIKILTEKGFALEKVCVVDQFGHSTHVETVALITRKDK